MMPHPPKVPLPHRVLIVDDHALVRQGLRQILGSTDDLHVCNEAATAAEALQLARRQTWDLVLLDLSLPDRDGLETLELLRKMQPGLRVLIFSMHDESVYAVRALKSGAAGYLGKHCSPEVLIGALRHVATGRKFISPELAEILARTASGERDAPPHEMLSNREFQTLCLLAAGKTIREAAETLNLSAKTVATYRSRLREKTGLKTEAELTRYALVHRLID